MNSFTAQSFPLVGLGSRGRLGQWLHLQAVRASGHRPPSLGRDELGRNRERRQRGPKARLGLKYGQAEDELLGRRAQLCTPGPPAACLPPACHGGRSPQRAHRVPSRHRRHGWAKGLCTPTPVWSQCQGARAGPGFCRSRPCLARALAGGVPSGTCLWFCERWGTCGCVTAGSRPGVSPGPCLRTFSNRLGAWTLRASQMGSGLTLEALRELKPRPSPSGPEANRPLLRECPELVPGRAKAWPAGA